MGVDVIIEDDRWQAAKLEALAKRAASTTLKHIGLVPDEWDITVLGADDSRVSQLNTAFRGKPNPTNVLSWPSAERGSDDPGQTPELPKGDSELGDIALAYETCTQEAADQGKSTEDHYLHLIVHGVLHLLGYDHEDDADGDLMESVEIAILRELGVSDPYM